MRRSRVFTPIKKAGRAASARPVVQVIAHLMKSHRRASILAHQDCPRSILSVSKYKPTSSDIWLRVGERPRRTTQKGLFSLHAALPLTLGPGTAGHSADEAYRRSDHRETRCGMSSRTRVEVILGRARQEPGRIRNRLGAGVEQMDDRFCQERCPKLDRYGPPPFLFQ